MTLESIKALLLETLDTKLDEKLDQLKLIKTDVDQLKAQVSKHGEQIEDSAVHDRSNNVVFYGIPYDRNEDAIDIAIEIGKSLDMNIIPEDIDTAHRLKTRNPVGPPPFIIRMVNRRKRDRMLVRTRAKQPHAGLWGGDSTQRVYANEHLSPSNQFILRLGSLKNLLSSGHGKAGCTEGTNSRGARPTSSPTPTLPKHWWSSSAKRTKRQYERQTRNGKPRRRIHQRTSTPRVTRQSATQGTEPMVLVMDDRATAGETERQLSTGRHIRRAQDTRM